MRKNKMAWLVHWVLKRTNEGKLKWEETSTEGFYLVSFPKYSLQIYTNVRGDSFTLGIYNQEGNLIDVITDSELGQLYQVVRNQVERRIELKADEVIDELLAELEKEA